MFIIILIWEEKIFDCRLSELVSIVPNLVLQIMFISHKMVTYLFQQTQLEWERWSERGADERTEEDLHRWRWWHETHYQQGLGWVSGEEGQSRWSWLLSQLIDLLPHSHQFSCCTHVIPLYYFMHFCTSFLLNAAVEERCFWSVFIPIEFLSTNVQWIIIQYYSCSQDHIPKKWKKINKNKKKCSDVIDFFFFWGGGEYSMTNISSDCPYSDSMKKYCCHPMNFNMTHE